MGRYFTENMSLKMKRLQIFILLFENMKEKLPQLVPSTSIADKLDICLTDLRQVLKNMKETGIIETNPEQQYSLITHKKIFFAGSVIFEVLINFLLVR